MKKLSEIQVDQIRELYSFKGNTPQQVADKLNISLSTVNRYIDYYAMCNTEELNFYYEVIKYLRKIGKIIVTNENKNYPFNLSNEDTQAIHDEVFPKYNADVSNQKELHEYYKNLNGK